MPEAFQAAVEEVAEQAVDDAVADEAGIAPHAWGIFSDQEQAIQHIGNRIVIYNGKAAYVSRVNLPKAEGCKGTVRLVKPNHNGGGQDKCVEIDDPKFNNFRFDPLGWINADNGAVFTELRPIRQTRRGYGDENVGVYAFPKNNSYWLERPDDFDLQTLMEDAGFSEMLRKEYPNCAETFNMVCGDSDLAIAVSRDLCIQSDSDGHCWLWRYAERVGYINNPVQITLGKRWSFLREELEEGGVIGRGVMVR